MWFKLPSFGNYGELGLGSAREVSSMLALPCSGLLFSALVVTYAIPEPPTWLVLQVSIHTEASLEVTSCHAAMWPHATWTCPAHRNLPSQSQPTLLTMTCPAHHGLPCPSQLAQPIAVHPAHRGSPHPSQLVPWFPTGRIQSTETTYTWRGAEHTEWNWCHNPRWWAELCCYC